MPLLSILKMEAIRFFETSVHTNLHGTTSQKTAFFTSLDFHISILHFSNKPFQYYPPIYLSFFLLVTQSDSCIMTCSSRFILTMLLKTSLNCETLYCALFYTLSFIPLLPHLILIRNVFLNIFLNIHISFPRACKIFTHIPIQIMFFQPKYVRTAIGSFPSISSPF
jgi:hypothetical protein